MYPFIFPRKISRRIQECPLKDITENAAFGEERQTIMAETSEMEKNITAEAAEESVQDAESAQAEKTNGHPRRPPLRKSLTEDKARNILLGASVVQLLLALLMYMLPSVKTSLLLAEAAVGIALALVVRYAPMEKLAVRVLLRSVVVAALAAAIILTIVAVLITNASRQSTDTDATSVMLTSGNYFMLAAVALPPVLFVLPALSLNIRSRRRFDIALLRVTAILSLIGTLLLTIVVLSYAPYGKPLILTEAVYTPVLFGHTFTITLNIDNILTRVLLCLCSAVMVFMAFYLKAKPKESPALPDNGKENVKSGRAGRKGRR